MPFSNKDFAVSKHETGFQATNGAKRQLNQIVQSLTNELGPSVVEMWFDNGQSIAVLDNRVELSASSEFHLNRIKTRFGSQLKRAVESSCGLGIPLEFLLTPQNVDSDLTHTQSNQSKVKTPAQNPPSQKAFTTEDKKRPVRKLVRCNKGIDSFWFGENNRLAQAGVSQMFDQVGQMSPFVIYGPSGSGKTHLLESMVFDARRKHNLKRCVYLSAEQFTSNFVQALRGTGLPIFRRKYRDLDVLAIDDVQFFAGKNATLAEFQHTVDNLTRNGKQVILASDRPPVDLGRLGTEITARMMSGLVCPLNYPDATGRKKIVRELCRLRGFNIPDDVIDLIGENLARDVRRLSGAINRIHALSVAIGEKVTVGMAQQALTDLFSVNGTITCISTIEKVVCDFCGVKPADMKSSSRQKKISAARMLAMYLSRQHTPNACSEIGEYFGGRSHSTVIAAQKKVASWLQNNHPIDLPHAKYPAKDALVRIESSLRLG